MNPPPHASLQAASGHQTELDLIGGQALLPAEAPASALESTPWRGRHWLVLGVLITWDGLVLDAIFWFARSTWGLPLSQHAYLLLLLAAWTMPLGLAAIGLYPGYAIHPARRFRKRAIALTFGWLLLITDIVLGHPGSIKAIPSLFACYGVALLAWPIAGRVIERLLRLVGWWGSPVVVLGAGKEGRALVHDLLKEGAIGLNPVAFYDDDPGNAGLYFEGIPVVGTLAEAADSPALAAVAILAAADLPDQDFSKLAVRLPFARLLVLPHTLGIQTMWMRGSNLGSRFCLDVPNGLNLAQSRYFKRAMDLLFGVPLALLAGPVVLLLAAWIRWSSPGPPFYSQEREGKDGQMFRVWKLRTMHLDAQERLDLHLAECPAAKAEWEYRFKLKDDPRILPVLGVLLRRTSLDELPQLWNVLRDEMSLVGPRPFPRYHLEAFSEDFQATRRSVLPGMTGLCQVAAREDADLDTQKRLDSFYIQNWSIWLDVDILIRTLGVVLRGTGS